MLLKRHFKVGKFTIDATLETETQYFKMEWGPRLPRPGELSKMDAKAYRSGRDEFLAEAAKAMGGGRVLVIEA